MNLSTLNWFAIIASAFAGMLIGGLWYARFLFGKAWMVASGMKEEDIKKANPLKTFGLSLLFSFIMAFNLALFLNDPSITAGSGAMYGFFTGLGWVAMAFFIVGQYEQRSTAYMLIHAGYFTISLTVMGLILGAWK